MIDTHSHIYAEEFDTDIEVTIQRAQLVGVSHIILPNVDSESLPRMLFLEAKYPDYCFAAIGLHPTSVNQNYRQELDVIKSELEHRKYIAIGEIGIDLYWDKTFYNEQVLCFQQQVEWALSYDLPVIIHIRNSFEETMLALEPYKASKLRGVFHSFTGTLEEANQLLTFENFKVGINGIVTFKNSGLAGVVSKIPLDKILLETDAPYLSPVPYRGKRNESSYLTLILDKLSEVFELDKTIIESQTDINAKATFEF